MSRKVKEMEEAEISFIAPLEEGEGGIPEQKEHFQLPARFGAVPVDEAPLGWEIETRRREVKVTKFQHAYPTIRLPLQEVRRVEFGHSEKFQAENEKNRKLQELFVVAITIKDAEQARDMLEEQFKLRTLLVTEQSDEKDREAARRLGKPGSPYEAVVSVLMLREGWDVPAVSVILLLRKFSSRVYGQQVVGRGLRLNVRDQDLQEICAIVDHEKLRHDWLWDIVGAKVRKDVEQATLFGDEDLPPKRKPQFVVNPALLISIPEPIEEEKADFDEELANIRIETNDYPRWQEVLDEFDYIVETEISRVEISGVVGQTLDGSGFREIREAPPLYGVRKPLSEIDDPLQLAELLKTSIRDIAAYLLAEEGIGSHELGYLYGVLMDHVRRKMLGGKTVGTAGIAELRHALHCRHRLSANFKNRPGLVASIVIYKEESSHADQ